MMVALSLYRETAAGKHARPITAYGHTTRPIHSRCFSHHRSSHAGVRVRNSLLLQHSDQWEHPIMAPALYNEGLASSQSTAPVTDTLPSLVSIGHSLPLLPRKFIQQIKTGEFIDFAELPPAKGRQITPANYNTQILFVQLQDIGQQRKLIPDYLTWSQCFAVYTAVASGIRTAP